MSKWRQSGTEMAPKWRQNDVKMMPKWRKTGAKSLLKGCYKYCVKWKSVIYTLTLVVGYEYIFMSAQFQPLSEVAQMAQMAQMAKIDSTLFSPPNCLEADI